MVVLKTYPVVLSPDPELPNGLFDPKWKRPEVASRVARLAYVRLVHEGGLGGSALVGADQLPRHKRINSDTRTFSLAQVLDVTEYGTRFRGGSYGELHIRQSFGGVRHASNYHAQAASFGVDARGGFFVRADVGRFGGQVGDEAALSVTFQAGEEVIGAAFWVGTLDSAENVAASSSGTDAALAAAFDRLTEAVIRFSVAAKT